MIPAIRDGNDVGEEFAHGPHRRQKVRDLAWKLYQNKGSINSITPLVVIKFVGDLWVVFGNRWLEALKHFQEQLPARRVEVRCIVHDLDDGTRPVHHALVAKFLHAATTENSGVSARIRERRRGW